MYSLSSKIIWLESTHAYCVCIHRTRKMKAIPLSSNIMKLFKSTCFGFRQTFFRGAHKSTEGLRRCTYSGENKLVSSANCQSHEETDLIDAKGNVDSFILFPYCDTRLLIESLNETYSLLLKYVFHFTIVCPMSCFRRIRSLWCISKSVKRNFVSDKTRWLYNITESITNA